MPTPTKPKSGGSIMSKKIFGLPAPVVLVGAALIVFLVYKRVQANSATSGMSASSTATAPDPNAVDPNTGLTYAQEEQAGLSQVAGPPSGNGTGTGGVGGDSGLSVADLEGLLQAFQGYGASTTNYYYGSGVAPTPTNPTGAGNGVGSANTVTQTNTGPQISTPAPVALASPTADNNPFTAPAQALAATYSSTGPTVVSEPTSGTVTYVPAGVGNPGPAPANITYTQLGSPGSYLGNPGSNVPQGKAPAPLSGYAQKSKANLH